MESLRIGERLSYLFLKFIRVFLVIGILSGIWCRPVRAEVDVNKSFSPINIFPGQTSTLTISLFNSNLSAATGVAFSDTLPINVAASTILANSCGGTPSFTTGAASLSGGTIPAGNGLASGTCTVSFTVTSATPGTYVNTVPAGGVTTTNVGNNANAATATLTVATVLPLTGTLNFSPNYLHITGTSTATITLTNPNIGTLTNVSFTDNLPTPLVLATPVTTGGTCGATFAKVAGGALVGGETAFNVAGGAIPANGGSCTVTYAVTVDPSRAATAQNGSVSNTIAANAVTTNQGTGSRNASSFSGGVTVQTGAAVSAAFAPASVYTNGTSTLTLTLRNYNLTAITAANFTNSLPTGITVSGPVSTTCGGTTSSTSSTISLSGGTIPAAASATTNSSGSCTVSATVAATATATDSVPAGTLNGINYCSANATLTVRTSPVSATMSFSPSSVIEGLSTTLTITLTNASGLNATITSFLDDLQGSMGTGFKVSAYPLASTSCGGTLSAAPGAAAISLSGGTIPANGNCLIVVPVDVPDGSVGSKTDTIQAAGLKTSQGNNENSVTANLTVNDESVVAKSYSPSTLVPGGVSRLTITIPHSSGTSAYTNMGIVDTLPTGHTVAAPANIVNTCGGSVAVTAGTSSNSVITLSGGSLGAGTTSCQIGINVKAPTGTGSTTNTIAIGALTNDQGDTNEKTATATLTRVTAGAVTLNEEFVPFEARGGAPVIMHMTMANNQSGAIALTNVSLTNSLPSGVVIYSAPATGFSGTGCTNGIITATPGTNSITLSGASISANATCTLSVTVTGYVGGNHIDNISLNTLTSDQGVTNNNSPSATLTIDPNVNVGTFFNPNPMEVSGSSTMTIRLFNTTLSSATGTSITDNLPTGLTATSVAANSCGGSVSITPNTRAALSGGTVAPNSYCDVNVNVTASATGSYTNSIPIGAAGSSQGANPDPASATLTVVAKPTIAITFNLTSIPAGGTIALNYVLTNPNSIDLTGAAFANALPAGLVVSASQNPIGTCTGASNNILTAGQSTPVFSGLTIPAGSSCNVNITVTAAAAGSYPNQASGITTSQTQTAGSASNSATLTVIASRPTIAKSFSPNSIIGGGVSALTFTLTNPNSAAISFSSTIFQDQFPTTPGAMTIANTTVTKSSSCSAANVLNYDGSTLSAGGSGIRVNWNGSLAAGAVCTITVNVTAGVPGFYQNASTVLTSSTAGTSLLTAMDNLTVIPTADLALAMSAASSTPLVGSTETFTITVTNNGPSPDTNVTIAAPLPSGYSFLSGTPSQGTFANGVWTAGTLAMSTQATLTISATVLPTGSYAGTASVQNADLTDPISGNNAVTVTPVPVPVADVTTSVTSPAIVNAGTMVSVPVSFTNNGPSSATGVTYSATLATGLSGVGCTGATCSYTSSTGNVAITALPGTLASGQTVNATLAYTAPASGSVTTTATIATTTNQGINSAPDTASRSTSITTGATVADVTTTITVPAISAAGSTISATLSYINLGPASAAGVSYGATLPTGLSGVSCSGATCSYTAGTGAVTIGGLPGTLTNGQTVTITLSYTAPASGSVPVAAGIATSTDQGTNSAADTAAGSTNISPVADVTVSITAPAVANAGNTVTIPVSFSNNGPSTATGVTYGVLLATGLSGVSCSGATCTYAGSTGSVIITGLPGLLASGQSIPVTLVYTAPASGSVTTTATIGTTTSQGINAAADSASRTTNITTGITTADVTTTVSAPPVAAVGSTVNVSVSYLNLGPAASTGMTYGISLPTGLSGVSCPGATCSYTSGTGAVVISGLPGTLANGQTAAVVLSFTAPSSGSVTTTSTIATSSNQGGNSAPDSAGSITGITSGATAADLITILAAPATVNAGSAVSVAISFQNIGPAAAAGVTYGATLPAGLSGVSCSGSGASCSYDSTSGAVTVTGLPGTLAPGQTVTLSLAYTAPAVASITATGTVATTTTETSTDNNSVSGTTVITPVADVATQVFAPSSANAATTVNVPISFTNNGPSTAYGVTYGVTLPAGLSSVSCGGTGITCSYSGTALAVTGLPTTLTATQSASFTLTYTAPT